MYSTAGDSCAWSQAVVSFKHREDALLYANSRNAEFTAICASNDEEIYSSYMLDNNHNDLYVCLSDLQHAYKSAKIIYEACLTRDRIDFFTAISKYAPFRIEPLELIDP